MRRLPYRERPSCVSGCFLNLALYGNTDWFCATGRRWGSLFLEREDEFSIPNTGNLHFWLNDVELFFSVCVHGNGCFYIVMATSYICSIQFNRSKWDFSFFSEKNNFVTPVTVGVARLIWRCGAEWYSNTEQNRVKWVKWAASLFSAEIHQTYTSY